MCWKLIRDGLVELLRSKGYTVWRARSREEHVAALVDKLLEEAYEIAKAVGGDGSLLEEAADLLEALLTLLKLHGYTLRDLLDAMEAKRREKGGFEGGFIAQVCR